MSLSGFLSDFEVDFASAIFSARVDTVFSVFVSAVAFSAAVDFEPPVLAFGAGLGASVAAAVCCGVDADCEVAVASAGFVSDASADEAAAVVAGAESFDCVATGAGGCGGEAGGGGAADSLVPCCVDAVGAGALVVCSADGGGGGAGAAAVVACVGADCAC